MLMSSHQDEAQDQPFFKISSHNKTANQQQSFFLLSSQPTKESAKSSAVSMFKVRNVIFIFMENSCVSYMCIRYIHRKIGKVISYKCMQVFCSFFEFTFVSQSLRYVKWIMKRTSSKSNFNLKCSSLSFFYLFWKTVVELIRC